MFAINQITKTEATTTSSFATINEDWGAKKWWQCSLTLRGHFPIFQGRMQHFPILFVCFPTQNFSSQFSDTNFVFRLKIFHPNFPATIFSQRPIFSFVFRLLRRTNFPWPLGCFTKVGYCRIQSPLRNVQ